MEPEDFYKRIRQKVEEEGEAPAYDPRLWERVKQKMPARRPWWLRLWPAWLAMAIIVMQAGTWWYFEQKWEKQQATIEEYRRELRQYTTATASNARSRTSQGIRDTVYITQYIRQKYRPIANKDSFRAYSRQQGNGRQGFRSLPSQPSYEKVSNDKEQSQDDHSAGTSSKGNRVSEGVANGSDQQDPSDQEPPNGTNGISVSAMGKLESLPAWGQVDDSSSRPAPWPPQKRQLFSGKQKISKLKYWIQSWQFEVGIAGGINSGQWDGRGIKRRLGGDLALGWQFAPHWKLRAGIGLRHLSTVLDEREFGNFSEEELLKFPQPIYEDGELPEEIYADLQGLVFPISLQYLFRPKKRLGGFIGVGATGQTPLYTQIKYEYEDGNDEEKYVRHSLSNNRGKLHWTEARLSAGIHYQLLPRIQVEASGYYGVPLKGTSLYNWKLQPRGLRLRVVWQWP